MKIVENIKQKLEGYNSVEKRYERLKNNILNQKARKEYLKIIKNYYQDIEISEKEEAIIFTQAYKVLNLKNPSAAKFPELDEYEIEKNDNVYKISGYTDCTNSYGAQVREKYSLEVLKKDNEWSCITNTGLKSLIGIIIILLLVFSPVIIGLLAMRNFY